MMDHINNKNDDLGHQLKARLLHKVHSIILENVLKVLCLRRREETLSQRTGVALGLVIHEVLLLEGARKLYMGLPIVIATDDIGIAHRQTEEINENIDSSLLWEVGFL